MLRCRPMPCTLKSRGDQCHHGCGHAEFRLLLFRPSFPPWSRCHAISSYLTERRRKYSRERQSPNLTTDNTGYTDLHGSKELQNRAILEFENPYYPCSSVVRFSPERTKNIWWRR